MTAPFNVGHDAVVNIVDGPTGAVITSFPPTTEFDFEPVLKNLESEPVNGQPIFREIWAGWKGTLTYDRYNSAIDDYFANQELQYWNSGSYTPNTITQTVTEVNGAVSQYQYLGVAMKLDTAGKFTAKDKVMQKISWMASTRKKIL